MGRLETELARRRGQRKVAEMKRRTGQLRRRVVATAIVGFVLLWAVVFVQMATGNDPALGGGASARPRAGGKRGSDRERRSPEATVPQPSEADDEGSSPVEGPEMSETAGIEAERAEAELLEAEQLEIEQQEAEARELEELEPVITGQS